MAIGVAHVVLLYWVAKPLGMHSEVVQLPWKATMPYMLVAWLGG